MTETPIGPAGVDELIGERVHAAMWRARITQKQLAEALGLDQGSVSRRLRGKAPWRASDVVTAASLVGVDPSELMPRHDELGHVGGFTRGNVVAEFKCTQAFAESTPLDQAARAWGKADLIADADSTAATGFAASLWAVGQ
jgi:transcriptional regulator with XRE-family HTH domain